jgi:large repetitive protein
MEGIFIFLLKLSVIFYIFRLKFHTNSARVFLHKMKKRTTYLLSLLTLLFSFVFQYVAAQDKNSVAPAVTPNWEELKASGQLKDYPAWVNQPLIVNGKQEVINHVEFDTRTGGNPTPSQSAVSCDCWLQRDASWLVVPFNGSGANGGPGIPPDYRNDDWCTPIINLPFNFCMNGQVRTSCYINNNGNISFGAPFATFTPLPFPNSIFPEMIAAFFGDVDTRHLLSGIVYYQLTATHLVVQWDGVGYYNTHIDKRNSFQLIITDGNDPLLGYPHNVGFCYRDMSWTTGDASGGVNGFGGSPATVGVNFGDGVNFVQMGLFDNPGITYLGPQAGDFTAPFSGVNWLDNQHFEFNWCPPGDTVNVPPVAVNLNFCDTITICEGDTAFPSAQFIAPEQSQLTTIVASSTLSNFNIISNVPGNTAQIIAQVIATAGDVGYQTITFTASDNGNPPQQTVMSIVIHVLAAPTASITPSNVSCFGGNDGQAIVTASSGNGTYTYTWTPSGGNGVTASNLTAGNYTVLVQDTAGCDVTQTVVITQPPVLTATASVVSNVSCYGYANGSATAAPGGGTPGYTYQWNPSGGNGQTATNLTAGNYTCTVTDSEGCTITSTTIITQPAVLSGTAGTIANVSCNGGNNGSAGIAPAGGTPNYTYSWTPSGGTGATASNLTAGNYTVLVTDANGCTTSSPVTITQPTALSAPGNTVTNVSCFGGNNGVARVVPAGGSPTYTYSWLPSGGNGATASTLTAGTYTAVVADANGCTATSIVNITQPPVLTASGSTITNINCSNANNGAVTVTPNGGSPNYTYTWTPAGGNGVTASNLTSGNYTVVVTDANGCSVTATASVTQSTPVSAAAANLTNVSCFGGSNGSVTVTPSNGTSPYTYLWTASSQTGQTATGLGVGSYTVTVTDSYGCTTVASASVTEPPVVTANASTLNNISCSGSSTGVATVVASGGVGGFSYSWSPAGGTNSTASGLNGGTYTVTVTDMNGCSQTAMTTVTQTNPVMLNVPPSTNVSCFSGNDGSASVSANGGTSPYTYSWSPSGGNGATAANLTAGNYTVLVVDSAGCYEVAYATITEPPVLNSNIPAFADVSCYSAADGAAYVTANGGTGNYTYSWMPSGGSNATASNLAAGSYSVSVTDQNGCVTVSNVVINEPALLVSNQSSLTDVSCFGGSNGSASINVAGGTPNYTYSWLPAGGNSATANNLTAGIYTVAVADAHGCITATMINITEPPLLTSNISSQTDVLCFGGNNGSATVLATGGEGNLIYGWNTNPSQTTSTATNLYAGTYTVTVTDENGCTTTSSVTITEPPTLISSISTQTNVLCFGGNNGSATVTYSGGSGTPTYSWNTNPVQTGATAIDLTATTYTVTVTDANGCTTSSSVTITEPPLLTANIPSHTDILCFGGNNGSAIAVTNGGEGTPTYSWNTNPVQTTSTASNLIAGNYTVTVTDANGCTASSSVLITEPAQLAAAISGSSNVNCNAGSDGSASVTVNGGVVPYAYIWSPAGGTDSVAVNLPADNYSVTITDANGCSTIQTVVITQPSALSLSVDGASTICQTQVANISAVPGGGTVPYAYNWNNGPTTQGQTVSPTTTTNYSVVVTDANGCTISQSVTVAVHPPLYIAANATPQVCAGSMGVVSSNAGGGNGGPYTYAWSTGQTTSSFTITGLVSTSYTVTLNDGCSPPVQAVTNIIVNPVPLVNFTPPVAESCVPTAVNFVSDTVGAIAGSTYSWTFGDGTTSSDLDPSHVYTNPGQYSVSLTITTPAGCTNTLPVTNLVTAHPIPVADFIAPLEVPIEGTTSIDFTNLSSGSNWWLWDFGDNSDTSSAFSPTHVYSDTGTYVVQLIVQSPNGCLDTTYRPVRIFAEMAIFIPNAFTPNGDGINDFFNALGIYLIDYDMWILDRWGGKIYHSNSINDPWNGTYFDNGALCQNGVYIYKIKVHDMKGKLHEFIGSVSLVR